MTKPTPSVKRKADEQLHPSWQAKKLQRVAIIPGQGKKIVFGQDDPTPETKAAPKTASSERLHPSWEAKRNKSASIAEFKGSKIVFDD